MREKCFLKALLCQSDGENLNKNVCCLQNTTGCLSNIVKIGVKEPCIGHVISLEKRKDNPGRKVYGNWIENGHQKQN